MNGKWPLLTLQVAVAAAEGLALAGYDADLQATMAVLQQERAGSLTQVRKIVDVPLLLVRIRIPGWKVDWQNPFPQKLENLIAQAQKFIAKNEISNQLFLSIVHL